MTNDVLKCQLKPINTGDYTVTFTPRKWPSWLRSFRKAYATSRSPESGRCH